jgi:hypothetical protein
MAEVFVRIATALAALVVVAALAVELRAHDIVANAGHVAAQPKPTTSAVDAQLKDLEGVQTTHPGSTPFLAAAALDLRIARYAAAARAATRATQREPKNFSAWVTLAVARGGSGDTAGEHRASVRAHQLNPLYPIPR